MGIEIETANAYDNPHAEMERHGQARNRRIVAASIAACVSTGVAIAYARTIGPVPYIAIAGASISIATIALSVLGGRGIWLSANWNNAVICVPPILACFVFMFFGTYESREHDGTTTITDSCHRWTGRTYFRELYQRFGVASTRLSGGLSPSGKQHGKWHFSDFGEDGFSARDTWYWYGDEVSEGEWHRLNR